MARKKKSYRKKNSAVPILPLIPLVGAGVKAMSYDLPQSKIASFGSQVAGYNINDGTFKVERALPFWTAEVAAVIGHKIASNPKVGINRMVRRATMGFIEL